MREQQKASATVKHESCSLRPSESGISQCIPPFLFLEIITLSGFPSFPPALTKALFLPQLTEHSW